MVLSANSLEQTLIQYGQAIKNPDVSAEDFLEIGEAIEVLLKTQRREVEKALATIDPALQGAWQGYIDSHDAP
ncbi:hypothetical protein K8942_00880 [Candidatus Peribacteria bacterium]|nr:MAG: hypothetical protein K8942_00880 [Candidatus Peribacteria bacterium]